MIMIISAPEDVHAQVVARHLVAKRGCEVRLLNLADFPMRLALTMRFNGHAESALTWADGFTTRLSEVNAVWWRRPQPFGVPGNRDDPAAQQFSFSETETAFRGLWQMHDALWVNNVIRDAAAAHKPWQLDLAQQIGLSIPETVMTNDPKEAQRFWQEHRGATVYKAFLATAFAWRETRVLRPEEEALAANVRYAPVIFQKYVPAVADLRAIVIGEEIFAAAAPSAETEYKADIRLNLNVRYQPHTLPMLVAERLLRLMRRLGLEYGAIDLRLTPEGEYVFLEINPAGQFLYIEQAAGLPIAASLADLLASGKATPRAQEDLQAVN
jgi:glutathione synthase/RimK-type ligase-like ATP-grasp enzyme